MFEKETAEDHEVVPVAVLGLHYLSGVDYGLVHVHDVGGASGGYIGICGFCRLIEFCNIFEQRARVELRGLDGRVEKRIP